MYKNIRFQINTSQDILLGRNTSIDDLQTRIQFLLDCLGEKYVDIFPTLINSSQDIDLIISVSNKFKNIHKCEGFKRHIQLYNTRELYSHLFVATISNCFRDVGILCLEPITPSTEGNPDIELNIGGSKIYIECKTIHTKRYYDYIGKNEIARFIFEEIATANQISIFFNQSISVEELRSIMLNDKLLSKITNVSSEQNIIVNPDITLNVMPPKPVIMEAVMQGIMEDNVDGVRKPGYVFFRYGRSVGVFGPIVDFSSSLEQRRRKSKKQYVKNYPFILAIDASNIVGDPKDHMRYINNWFNPRVYRRYSAVMLFSIFQDIQNREIVKARYFENFHAADPLPDGFVKQFPSNISFD